MPKSLKEKTQRLVKEQEDPHVSADPRHPANRGGESPVRKKSMAHVVDVDGVKHYSQMPFLTKGGKVHGPAKGKQVPLPKGAKYRSPVKTEESYSYVTRAKRVGDVIAGRTAQGRTDKVSKAQSKLLGMGAKAAADKMMGDITRERLGLKK